MHQNPVHGWIAPGASGFAIISLHLPQPRTRTLKKLQYQMCRSFGKCCLFEPAQLLALSPANPNTKRVFSFCFFFRAALLVVAKFVIAFAIDLGRKPVPVAGTSSPQRIYFTKGCIYNQFYLIFSMGPLPFPILSPPQPPSRS